MAARRRDRVPEFRRGEGIADARAHLLHQRSARAGGHRPRRASRHWASGPLGYTDEVPAPLVSVPNASMPQRWPVAQPNAPPSSPVSSQPLPPPQAGAPQSYPSYPQQPYPQQSYPQQAYRPPSTTPVGSRCRSTRPAWRRPKTTRIWVSPVVRRHPDHGGPAALYTPAPPLGPPRDPLVTGAAGPVEVKPAATLACPIVSEARSMGSPPRRSVPANRFRQPVVEDQTNLRLFLPRHERQSERAYFRARLRQRARHRRGSRWPTATEFGGHRPGTARRRSRAFCTTCRLGGVRGCSPPCWRPAPTSITTDYIHVDLMRAL